MFELNAAYQAALHLNEKGLLDLRQFNTIETAMAAYLPTVCGGVSTPGSIRWRDGCH
jgi:hypothetical protein